MFRKIILIGLLAVLSIGSTFAQRIEIMGAGATFPYPLYSRMFEEYSRTRDRVNYQGIGSGGGINQLIARTTDFGGTDAIVTPDVEERSGCTILHIPTCLGAVVVTYNLQLPGGARLRFTPDLIADIFMGNIRNWNDSRIAAVNPDVALPRLPITVVYRSDGSGTTFIFTEYLSRTSRTWADRIGFGTAVNWPAGIGARGNPGVAGTVNQTRGAIGYVELIYALSNDIPYGDVQNRTGNFITPSMQSVSHAANVDIPADTRVSLVDTAHPEGYPISSFTWVILFKEQNYNNRNIERARATVNLIRWMINEGQSFAKELNYAPLPEAARNAGMDLLKSVTYGGRELN
jgi:phosphate transport system substrate-binding protein